MQKSSSENEKSFSGVTDVAHHPHHHRCLPKSSSSKGTQSSAKDSPKKSFALLSFNITRDLRLLHTVLDLSSGPSSQES